jgi:hypothetical protein
MMDRLGLLAPAAEYLHRGNVSHSNLESGIRLPPAPTQTTQIRSATFGIFLLCLRQLAPALLSFLWLLDILVPKP